MKDKNSHSHMWTCTGKNFDKNPRPSIIENKQKIAQPLPCLQSHIQTSGCSINSKDISTPHSNNSSHCYLYPEPHVSKKKPWYNSLIALHSAHIYTSCHSLTEARMGRKGATLKWIPQRTRTGTNHKDSTSEHNRHNKEVV